MGLVREFLEHFNMEFTLAVFDPESNIVSIYLYVLLVPVLRFERPVYIS